MIRIGNITKYTQYLYDAGGNRVKKLTWKPASDYESVSYIDGIYEYRTDGADEQNLLHILDNTSRIAMIRLGDDFGDTTPAVQYNLEDHLGNSVVLLETNSANVSKEEYYAFGETSFGSYAKKRYKYCGKERDEESGMYYYGARYYSAWMCRFVSVDPLARDYPYLTPYNYAGNKPITFKDIEGMQSDGDQPVNNEVSTENNHESQVTVEEQTGTYIIIHGAGWDNPVSKGHNQGDGFKKSAEAQKQNLIAQGVPEESIIVAKAYTEQEFLDIVNKEYESGKIVSLDIYSHMSNNGINFGGNEGDEVANATSAQKDYRILNNWSNPNNNYNPDNDNEVEKINAENFVTNARVTLWGCNAGFTGVGYGTPIAQAFSNHLNSNQVRAFNDYSRFKQNASGKNIYDGTMIRESDHKKRPQPVNQTRFFPN